MIAQVNADHIPQSVKEAVATDLEAFANNPLIGLVRDEIAGSYHLFEFWNDEFLWRFAFNVVTDGDGQPIGIGTVAINYP